MLLQAAICVTLFVYVNAFAGQVTEKFPHKVALNANFTLYWKTSVTDITFEAHVRTQGWAGIGFTNDGSMFPGDAVMGFVSDSGKGNIADYHTVGHRPPIMDSSQDYTLLASRRVPTGTMLKFSRPLDTQDSNDMTLQAGNTWVIWGYGDVDPVTSMLHYHGANRGAMQLALLGSSAPVGK